MAAQPSPARALLLQGRCPACAERIPRLRIVRGGACPCCESPVQWDDSADRQALIDEVMAGFARRRWLVYGAVALSGLMTGWLPMFAGLLRFVGLLTLHIAFVKRPLLWLTLPRRFVTRLSLKLFLAILTLFGLLLDALMAPFIGPNAIGAAILSGLAAVAYGEGALRFIAGRLRREAREPGLDAWEWLLPIGLLVPLVGVVAGLVVAISALLYALQQLPAWLFG